MELHSSEVIRGKITAQSTARAALERAIFIPAGAKWSSGSQLTSCVGKIPPEEGNHCGWLAAQTSLAEEGDLSPTPEEVKWLIKSFPADARKQASGLSFNPTALP